MLQLSRYILSALGIVCCAAFLGSHPACAANEQSVELGGGLTLKYSEQEPKKGEAEEDEFTATVSILKGGKEVQRIMHSGQRRDPEMHLEVDDYNLDGHKDFSLFSSAGNVSTYLTVFLFDPAKKSFVESSAFSDIPCLTVDPAKKRVSGMCFHNNACNNWVEEYAVTGLEALELVSSSGTECPDGGEGDYYYTFERTYKNGALASEKKERVKMQ